MLKYQILKKVFKINNKTKMTKTQLRKQLIKTPSYLRWSTVRIAVRFNSFYDDTQAAVKSARKYMMKLKGGY